MRRGRTIHWVGLAAAGIAASVALAAPASAVAPDVKVTLSVSKTRVNYDVHHGRFTVFAHLHTDASGGTVAIELSANQRWPEDHVYGSPLGIGRTKLEGPGSVSFFGHGGGGRPGPACFRSPEAGGGGLQVTLPANADSTLVLPVSLTAPPWRDTQLTPRLLITSPYSSGAHGTQHGLEPPSIRRVGPTGVHITMDAGGVHHLLLTRNRRILIGGRTFPRVKHRIIRLGYDAGLTGTPRIVHLIGTVTTNSLGHFHFTFHAVNRGTFRIVAVLPKAPKGLLPDTNCDVWGKVL